MNPFPDTISSYLTHARWVASDLRQRNESAWRNANILMSVPVGGPGTPDWLDNTTTIPV